ncbi:MAG: bifunctional ADP-dependent NAD(P)H-hydrate dehydratase/NAD(P)H-hydrate epimerase [Chloroflexi bacterium]|nr:MAG: bifunctional ADP-dependent NAD(P)H-hydrate dehydratase/NAD(P)H-hydrate epimerase [Chloroflexota bacterium]
MTLLLTAAEMRAAEALAVAAGTPEPELMRRAGSAIALWAERVVGTSGPRRALALVGPGNNGGDALVALAGLVAEGWECAAVFVDRAAAGHLPADDTALAQVRRISLAQCQQFQPGVILDGIYGIGGRAALVESARAAITVAHDIRGATRCPLIAIDVPSGVDATSGAADPGAFQADLTLCLGYAKLGLIHEPAATRVGELVVVDIGIPAPAISHAPRMLDASLARRLAPRRLASAHKSTQGSVLIIGGATSYYGAPRLAGEAALRSGCGLVTLAVPERILDAIAAQVPELTFVPLYGTGAQQAATITSFLEEQSGRYTALVIGPGLGRDARAKDLLDSLIAQENRHVQRVPVVLDADALFWLASRHDIAATLARLRCVLTPHAGEFARLLKTSVADVRGASLLHARDAATSWNQVVVLKSGYSLVAAPGEPVWVAPRAMPELATAGTGDVFSGVLGGLLAQGLAQFDAARVGMFIGAMAGRAARARRGVGGVIARDVIDGLPEVARDLVEPAWDAGWMTNTMF